MSRIPDSIKKPPEILGGNASALQSIYSHARDLLAMQSLIRAMVPGTLYVAAIDNGLLHLITPSAAVATRVRYNQHKLVAALSSGNNPRSHIFPIEKIKVSVKPDPVATVPKVQEAMPLSPESAQHLAATAKYIEDDGLRKALIQLSNRAKDT